MQYSYYIYIYIYNFILFIDKVYNKIMQVYLIGISFVYGYARIQWSVTGLNHLCLHTCTS